MSDVTPHSLVEKYLNSDPELRDAYLNDAPTYHQVNIWRRFLEAADREMKQEGIPEASRARVLERIACPTPVARFDGWGF